MKLFYRKYGNGPPLFILHGLFGSSDNWVTFARKISDLYTVYLPDLRNHGLSPHSEVHDYNSMRDDLHELITELKIGKFFLAGHSMGGKIAAAYSLEWPSMLNGLLIADISPFVNGKYLYETYRHYLKILNAVIACDLTQNLSRAAIESHIASAITDEKERGLILKNLHRTAGNSFEWKINAIALHKNLERIMEMIDRSKYSDSQVTGFPVLFLKGGNSDYLPEDDYRDIRKTYPGADFYTIPGAGHWVQADRPDEVAECFRMMINEC